eukprot:s321_g16.t1
MADITGRDSQRNDVGRQAGRVAVKVTAKNILIACGGRPSYGDYPGVKECCISSDDIFWQKKAPGKTLVVGASYIALESWKQKQSKGSGEDENLPAETDNLERPSCGPEQGTSQIRYPQEKRSCRYDDLPTFPVRPNFASFENSLRPASQCVDPYHPSNTPIYQTSTFVQPSSSEFGPYDYTRSGNPTRTALEKHVGARRSSFCILLWYGCAAHRDTFAKAGTGNSSFIGRTIALYRTVTFVDTTDLSTVAKAITSKTKLIHTESPSNPRMRITDLRKLAVLAHQHNVLLSVDSTMMPPVICQPLLLGVDIVVHSATKFFSGHADCTGGLVCVRDPELAHRVAFLQNAEGTALAPFECFLFLRGIKTMWLRVNRAQENAIQIAKLLSKHPLIKEVFFPGPGGCSSEALRIHNSQSSGPGPPKLLNCWVTTAIRIASIPTLASVSLTQFCQTPTLEKKILDVETPQDWASWSVLMTVYKDLVRLSVGIEEVRDLMQDLQRALDFASSQRQIPDHDGYDSRFEDLPVVPRLPPDIEETHTFHRCSSQDTGPEGVQTFVPLTASVTVALVALLTGGIIAIAGT